MLISRRVPKTIQWIIKLFIIYLFIFTAFRIATVICFKPGNISVLELGPAFWLGLKYDLRWIAIILLPIAVLSLYPRLSPFYSERNKKIWTIYLGFLTLLVLFFYGADFGQFAYINARLNADALIFAEDPRESLQMVWQSYPIVWILLGLAGAVVMMTWMFRRMHVDVTEKNINIHKFSYRRRWHAAALLLLGWFVYGFLTVKPLDFFRAFGLNDEFKSNLALNPLQNFFTTLRFRKADHNNKAAEYYSTIAKFLQLQNNNNGHNPYTRLIQPGSKALESQPNIVVVICESFSMYKSSMSGNPLNSTPYFNEMCNNGIFFERCFTPTFGTARGVFALLTGIPDVQLSKFSTRNEESVKQRTIVNNFEGYEKFYFLGGRSQFNNFKGLFENIDSLHVYEEGDYKAANLNVWGISDKNLFLEANDILAKQQKPFFAFIQTADNHRPFDIPAEDTDFKREVIPDADLVKYGFESLKEYHAFAYTDYCIKKFMEAAKNSPYFNNTIFVFTGDHGVEGNASAIYPQAWTEQRLSDEHVPLLFYAPALLMPQKRTEAVSQIDILPTIAGMLQQPYLNTTLGRDLLDTNKKEDAAFIIYHAPGWIGVVNNDYYFRKNIRIKKEELVPVRNNLPVLNNVQQDSVKAHLSQLTSAIYETARWMLINNK
ncbi:MAG: sulfatase-like hydrolase/transferase [Ferruginibacter sp.]|nr:sulfatase-like hydrolase/transferase [Bacteroidota bacterium]MBX2919788.1 sulfatase-like hydrolase/transferase [Ferruginibacter sp.]MCB0709915.1 sulfatase-like hydrolase/transferase [Chitinophagaceae bacterium]